MRIIILGVCAVCLSSCSLIASTDDLTKGGVDSEVIIEDKLDASDDERDAGEGLDARSDSQGTSNNGSAGSDGGDGRDASDALVDADQPIQEGEPCDAPEAVVCASSASASRLLCDPDQEVWVRTEPCGVGQACDTQDEGVCKPIVPPCLGQKPGDVVCDGLNRHTCGPDLVTSDLRPCASNAHCQQATGSECAVCVDGEHSCDGAVLLVCNDERDGWTEVTTCDTVDLCNAGAKQCTDKACVPDQRICDGDALQRCNSEQTGFEFDQDCEPGLCDEIAGQCDICSNDSCTADRTTRRECSDDGQTLDDIPCPAETPICLGNGNCVQCETLNDCQAPECQVADCRLNECVLSSASITTSCSIGHCDGEGNCVECTESADCPTPPICRERVCTGSNECDTEPSPTRRSCDSDRLCDGEGNCVGCLEAVDCPSPPTCRDRVCKSNECDTEPSDARTSCGSGRLCDGDGNCVECLAATDCPTPPTCQERVCTGSNECDTDPSAPGTSCGSGEQCDGAGNCVACIDDGDCAAPETLCRDYVCVNPNHSVGWDSPLPDILSLAIDTLYFFPLPPLLYDAQLTSFGVFGTEPDRSLKMALYQADGTGLPNGLPLAETERTIQLLNGGTEMNPTVQASLSAGEQYWIALAVTPATAIRAQEDGGAKGYRIAHPFGNFFPAADSSAPGIPTPGFIPNVFIKVVDTE